MTKSLLQKPLRNFDSFEINQKWIEDSDGNMRVPVIIAQAGVLDYKYTDDNGEEILVREVKLPKDILSKHTVFSAEGKQVTDEHPKDMLDSSNYIRHIKGVFINPKIVNDSIHGEIVIYDKELQDSLKSGEKYQISTGFWHTTEIKNGIFNGKIYDAIQRDISINHIAIVKNGRAGDNVKVKLDSADAEKLRSAIMTEEEQKKIDEYEKNKLKSEEEANKKKADEDEEKKKVDEENEKADEENDVPDKIKQLEMENKLLKESIEKLKQTDSVSEYTEARETALKIVTDDSILSHADSAEYYKKEVVKFAGLDSKDLAGSELTGAYNVAKILLTKDNKVSSKIKDSQDSKNKTELDKALEESEKQNDAFSGKRGAN